MTVLPITKGIQINIKYVVFILYRNVYKIKYEWFSTVTRHFKLYLVTCFGCCDNWKFIFLYDYNSPSYDVFRVYDNLELSGTLILYVISARKLNNFINLIEGLKMLSKHLSDLETIYKINFAFYVYKYFWKINTTSKKPYLI